MFAVVALLFLIIAGAIWMRFVEDVSVAEEVLRIEVLGAFAVSALVLSAPLWNEAIRNAVQGGSRASALFTIIPALALPAIIFPRAAVNVLEMNGGKLTQAFVKTIAWLFLAASVTLIVSL